MSAPLTLYTNPNSRGRIARWMLEEIGAPYDVVALDYDTSMKAPEYLAINPMGKVPALCHGPSVITECAAICAYLADTFPEAELAPTVDERAAYYRWMFFLAGPMEAAVTDSALGFVVPPEHQRMAGYGTLAQATDQLEMAVSQHPFVCGSRFTAADVFLGPTCLGGLLTRSWRSDLRL